MFGAWTTKPENMSQPVIDVLERAKELKGIRAGVGFEINAGRVDKLGEYVEQHMPEFVENAQTKPVASAIRSFGDMIRRIERDPSMPMGEKRERIRQLRANQYELTQALVGR